MRNSLLLSGLGSSSNTNHSSVIKICLDLRTKLKYWFKYTDQRCNHMDYIDFFQLINYRTAHSINDFFLI